MAEKLFKAPSPIRAKCAWRSSASTSDETIYPEVLSEVAELARNARFGDGFEDGVEYGPINNRPQFERVQELVEDAKAAGATVHTGGETMGKEGYFYAPTVLSDIAEGVRIVDEETNLVRHCP